MYDIWYVFYCSYTFQLRDSTTTRLIFYYLYLLTNIVQSYYILVCRYFKVFIYFCYVCIISIYYIPIDILIITTIYFLIYTYYQILYSQEFYKNTNILIYSYLFFLKVYISSLISLVLSNFQCYTYLLGVLFLLIRNRGVTY